MTQYINYNIFLAPFFHFSLFLLEIGLVYDMLKVIFVLVSPISSYLTDTKGGRAGDFITLRH